MEKLDQPGPQDGLGKCFARYPMTNLTQIKSADDISEDELKFERLAFESWIKQTKRYTDWTLTGGRNVGTEYQRPRVQEAWLAWLASKSIRQNQAAVIAQCKEALEQIADDSVSLLCGSNVLSEEVADNRRIAKQALAAIEEMEKGNE